MASGCIAERGDCLRDLGRLDDSASAYEEAIRRAVEAGAERGVAVGKGNLGTVRLLQRRYPEALAAYEEARESFTRLSEPGTVGGIWYQTGMVYEGLGQFEAAEAASRQALAINVLLGDLAEQARTLLQLGTLYGEKLGRFEDAAAFFRQAADLFEQSGDAANEGRARNNLAEVLRKLCRFADARGEILRAIESKAQSGHSSEPWASWVILAKIEADAGRPEAEAKAKQKSISCFLAYRRDGGENHDDDGRLALTVGNDLRKHAAADVVSGLQRLAAKPDLQKEMRPFVLALQAIAAGSRDRGLADSPDLDYTMSAEILFLLETLEQADRPMAG
jgi:tetratricopeptide (TPR) repeat protein